MSKNAYFKLNYPHLTLQTFINFSNKVFFATCSRILAEETRERQVIVATSCDKEFARSPPGGHSHT